MITVESNFDERHGQLIRGSFLPRIVSTAKIQIIKLKIEILRQLFEFPTTADTMRKYCLTVEVWIFYEVVSLRMNL